MQIELIKGHGSGNDFLLIDEITNNYTFSDQQRAELAQILCDRQTNLGADGILFVMKSEHAGGRMRVFNADGTEASMCGNGLRLVARYICDMFNLNSAVIETMKTNLRVSKQPDLYTNVFTFQVEISPVSFQVSDLPLKIYQSTLKNEKIPQLTNELVFTALAVPNPHLIALVDAEQLNSNLQKDLSEKVNGPNEWFPDGVNVSFVNVISPGNIYVRTFERGVGFTNACGTAMSASTLVTCLNGINEFENVINVYNDGGRVQCIVHDQNGKFSIDLIGNATYLYKANIEVDYMEKMFTLNSRNDFTEQLQYEKLQKDAHEFLTGTVKG